MMPKMKRHGADMLWTNRYIWRIWRRKRRKMKRRRHRKKDWGKHFYKACSYIQTCPTPNPLHTDAFTQRSFYTQTLLHTDAFTHRRFYTQTLLHTDTSTHRRFYTQKLLHTSTFTHKHSYTSTHRRSYVQKLLHTEAFAHRSFYTQTLLHTDAFTHRSFYTQMPLHTDAVTHRSFYTQNPVHIDTITHGPFNGTNQICKKTCFSHSNVMSCERVAADTSKSQFYHSFWRSNLISCERVAAEAPKSQFYLSFWRSTLISRERVAAETPKSQFYRSFWRSNLISCERVAMSWRLVSTARGLKREEKKKERERDRGQEERERGREREGERMKMWRWEDVKKMWRWEDVNTWRCIAYSRPPLLEEPFAQTLSENWSLQLWHNHSNAICKQQVAIDHGSTRIISIEQQWCSHSSAICKRRVEKTMNYVCNSSAEQHWCSHSKRICKSPSVELRAQQQRSDAATPIRFASSRLHKPIELRCHNRSFSRPKPKKAQKELQRNMKGAQNSEKHQQLIAATLSHLNFNLWKRSFRARCPSTSESWRCENEALVRDFPQNLIKLKIWKRSFRGLPSKSETWRCKNEAFMDFPQELKVEDVKAKLSCETFLKISKLKIWKRSFRGLPSKTESGRCENEAFLLDFCQILKVKLCKAKLEVAACTAGLLRKWSDPSRTCSGPAARQSFPIHLPKHVFCCKTQHLVCATSLKNWKLKMQKRSFRGLPSRAESWRCESEALVWDFPQNLQVEDMKTKLSWTSLQKWKLKMWKRSFRAKRRSKTESCEDVKTKLSLKTFLENCEDEAGPIREWSAARQTCLPRPVLCCKT